ncbi:MAG: hypothetical protein Q9220_005291 [cf. Caloplaca sp. 1 TL-2023]
MTLGFVVGPIVAAPLSESIGRRMVYLVSIPCFALFVLGSALSQSIAALIICRFFAGVFASPGLSIGGGTIADIWKPAERTIPYACTLITPYLGPALGPMVGAYVVRAKGWRWTQWTTIFLAIAVFAFSLFMRETYKAAILSQRTRGAHQTADSISMDALIDDAQRSKNQRWNLFILLRPIHMLFTESTVAVISLYVAYSFSTVYAFFAAVPWIYARVYGFDLTSQGLVFLSLAVGYVLAIILIVLGDLARKKKQKNLGSLAVAPHGSNIYGPLYGASATAASRILAYLMGVAFPLFTIQMYSNLGIPWASSLLAFLSLAMMPVPWVFYRFGPRLRAMSKYMLS